MPRIIAGIDIERKYTIHEIMDMYYKGLLKPIAISGYGVRAEADANGDVLVGFVPWYDTAIGRDETNRAQTVTVPVEQMRQDVEREHPMIRTTPQEKVARMALRLMADAKRYGTIPGLTDAEIASITGEAWKSGETSITMDMVRRVAAHFLGIGEKTNRDAESHRTTRVHPLA